MYSDKAVQSIIQAEAPRAFIGSKDPLVEAYGLRLSQKEIEAKIERLKKRASEKPDDADDIAAEIGELKKSLKGKNELKKESLDSYVSLLTRLDKAGR